MKDTKKVKPTIIKTTIHIPGLGKIKVGSDILMVRPGESSPRKIIAGFKKAQKGRYLPPVEHACP